MKLLEERRIQREKNEIKRETEREQRKLRQLKREHEVLIDAITLAPVMRLMVHGPPCRKR